MVLLSLLGGCAAVGAARVVYVLAFGDIVARLMAAGSVAELVRWSLWR